MFDFDTRQLPGGIAIVNVRGSLDESNRAYFFDCVKDLTEEGFGQIIVDCHGLGFISSSGLAALIRARSQAQSKGGKIYLSNVNAMIANVLNVTKLNRLLAIFPTTNEILAQLGPDSSGHVSLDRNLQT